MDEGVGYWKKGWKRHTKLDANDEHLFSTLSRYFIVKYSSVPRRRSCSKVVYLARPNGHYKSSVRLDRFSLDTFFPMIFIRQFSFYIIIKWSFPRIKASPAQEHFDPSRLDKQTRTARRLSRIVNDTSIRSLAGVAIVFLLFFPRDYFATR